MTPNTVAKCTELRIFIMLKNQPVCNADVFIIPNRSISIKDALFNDTKHLMSRTFSMNYDTSPNEETDLFVEVWVTTPGNDNSNWIDHYVDPLWEEISKKEMLDGKSQWRLAATRLPKAIFDGYKEGDVVTVNLPITRWTENGTIENAWIKVSLCLAQTKYRYKDFGKFEEVLRRV